MAQHEYANGDEPRTEPENAIAMLQADHRQVQTLFQQYADTPDPYLKQIIAEYVFAEWELHTLLEETIFYPAFAEQADAVGKLLVEGALHDHQEMRELIADLREIADDVAFEASFQALRDQVEQHVEAEEREMFPLAEEALVSHLEEVAALMQERKAQLLAS